MTAVTLWVLHIQGSVWAFPQSPLPVIQLSVLGARHSSGLSAQLEPRKEEGASKFFYHGGNFLLLSFILGRPFLRE